MSEFEFLAVLLSIVFGLALTQALSGAIRLLYDDPIDDEQLAWALCIVAALMVKLVGLLPVERHRGVDLRHLRLPDTHWRRACSRTRSGPRSIPKERIGSF
jgi:membrane protease YdiL (CAAX protease family)